MSAVTTPPGELAKESFEEFLVRLELNRDQLSPQALQVFKDHFAVLERARLERTRVNALAATYGHDLTFLEAAVAGGWSLEAAASKRQSIN